MRHHDIERLKQAASRYAANKYTVGDMEELSEFACNALFEPPCSEKIRKVDNGDGAETWYGLPVVVPVGLIPDDETPVDVRSLSQGIERRLISSGGNVMPDGISGGVQRKGDLRIILADKPQPVTWNPPASLPDGEYEWTGARLIGNGGFVAAVDSWAKSTYADWITPPRAGRYRKTGNVATWIGE